MFIYIFIAKVSVLNCFELYHITIYLLNYIVICMRRALLYLVNNFCYIVKLDVNKIMYVLVITNLRHNHLCTT